MANEYKILYQGQPGTGAANAYTVGVGKQAIVKHVRIVNTNATTPQTITVFADDSGGGLAAANQVLPPTTVPAGGCVEMDVTWTLQAGATVGFQASAATTLTVTMFGLEIV